MSLADREKLESNPNLLVETMIKEYIAGNTENRLPAYNDEPVVDEPLVGFAAGNDPIFHEFKKSTVVGEFHFTPEEARLTYLDRQHKKMAEKKTSSPSVISIVFTATNKTRMSNRPESVMASPRWQYAFGRGMVLMELTLQYLVDRLEALGYQSISPICTRPAVFLWRIPEGPASDWSEKHVAYAAGLGSFGLNSGLITLKGAALHCGSVITDLELTPTPRAYDHYQANCLYYRNGSCQRCVQRCPSGSIRVQGYDSRKCFFYHEVELPKISRQLGREPKEGGHPICSLCQTNVPCERGIPREPSAKGRIL